ncbi:hypothetical protein ACWY2R_07135 [Enterococcus avium]
MKLSRFCVGLSGISFALLTFSFINQIFLFNEKSMSYQIPENQSVAHSSREATKEFLVPQILSDEDLERNEKQRTTEKAAISNLLMETEKKTNEPKGLYSVETSDFSTETSEIPRIAESFQEEITMIEEPIIIPSVSTDRIKSVKPEILTIVPQVVNITILQQLVHVGEKYEAWLYTSKSMKQLANDLKKAEILLDDSTATQQKIDAQILSLLDSMKKIERKSDIELSKLVLFHVIEEMEVFDEKDYSKESFEGLYKVLKIIKQVYENPQASIDEVKAAIRQGEDALIEIREP